MLSLEYLRQVRIFDYAVFDLTLAFLGMAILAPLLSKLFLKMKIVVPFSSWLFFTLPIGILTHLLVGNYTSMTRQFFDVHDHYILKIVILLCIFLGLRQIHTVSR